jgi:hypothetical protein
MIERLAQHLEQRGRRPPNIRMPFIAVIGPTSCHTCTGVISP